MFNIIKNISSQNVGARPLLSPSSLPVDSYGSEHLLQDFQSVSEYFGMLFIKELK